MAIEMSPDSEIFDLVDENDQVIGEVSRKQVHSDPSKIHRVVHILVLDSSGELYLQKRSEVKDISPGKWDTSVGGHVNKGESYEMAAIREMKEELGIESAQTEFLYKYIHRNSIETEYVCTYKCVWDGAIDFNEDEIEKGQFWSIDKILSADPEKFTPNFLDDLERFQKLACK